MSDQQPSPEPQQPVAAESAATPAPTPQEPSASDSPDRTQVISAALRNQAAVTPSEEPATAVTSAPNPENKDAADLADPAGNAPASDGTAEATQVVSAGQQPPVTPQYAPPSFAQPQQPTQYGQQQAWGQQPTQQSWQQPQQQWGQPQAQQWPGTGPQPVQPAQQQSWGQTPNTGQQTQQGWGQTGQPAYPQQSWGAQSYQQQQAYPASPYADRMTGYASWGTRFLALLIDGAPLVVLGIILGIISVAADVLWLPGLGALIGLPYAIWNLGFKQGTTGMSIGKQIMKIKVISETTGQPLGVGSAIGRMFASGFLNTLPLYVGWLWPLWDDKSQHFGDKIVGSIVVPAPETYAGQNGYPGTGGFTAQGGYSYPQQQAGYPQQGGYQQTGYPQQSYPTTGGFQQQNPYPQQQGGYPQQGYPQQGTY